MRRCAASDILYSGGEDRAVRAWSLDANECVAALQGRARPAPRLVAHNNVLYSGGGDDAVRAWSLAIPDYLPD